MLTQNVNNMPGASSETETENDHRFPRQEAEGDKASRNAVSVISKLADDHLTLVRNISTCLAIAGVVVIARSIRLISKFQTASEIPPRFIDKNVSLRGKVQSVTENGIQVEHVPIHVPVLSALLSKHRGVSPSQLLVSLAGVDLTPEGSLWLQKNLEPAQIVWLKLISRQGETIHCFVTPSKQRSAWTLSLNEEVLKLGLARTAPVHGVPPESRLYWRLHKRLHRAEVKAEKKGRGLWKEDSRWERVSKALRDNVLFRLMRRLFKRT
ncbi:protein C3orf33 homolog isoform 1-T1 [Synchiropus picturatus]